MNFIRIYVKSFMLMMLILNFFLNTKLYANHHSDRINNLTQRLKLNFDLDWKFSLNPAEKSVMKNHKNITWKKVTLPHDWSISGQNNIKNGDWQSGYLPSKGIGYYLKEFDMPENSVDKMISITFDGVYMNSEVWINDHYLGKRPNGNIGFSYLISPYLKKKNNTLIVKVDHSKNLSARWYTGAGIYRHVWLEIYSKTHIADKEFYIHSALNEQKASIFISAPILSDKTDHNYNLKTSIIDNNGNKVSVNSKKIILKNHLYNFRDTIQVSKPIFWGVNNPYLYHIEFELSDNSEVLDTYKTHFGIRKLEFSGEWGFKLNDENLKIKGVCMHQEAGIFGAALPDKVWENRLSQLKDMGVNAIRTTHNPFGPVFYDLCDSLGILVLNEAFDGWEAAKATDDYGNYFNEWWEKDLSDFIKRDRNHPSVFMWSIGNEVKKPTIETQTKLIKLIRGLDSTRPITQGGIDPTRGMSDDASMTLLDVKGFNGDGEEIGSYENYHNKFPQVPIIGTEVPHTYQTRGYYQTKTQWRRKDFPAPWEIESGQAGTMKGLEGKIYTIDDLNTDEIFKKKYTLQYLKNGNSIDMENLKPWSANLYYQSSYDNASVRSSARKAWQRTVELPFVMGQFRWTAYDYIGESNKWPSRMANFGVIDLNGIPKDHFYLYQSLWDTKPMVHLLPHWTHEENIGDIIPVVAYTNCDSVKLTLNNKDLKTQTYKGEQLVWHIPYTPGVVKAYAYKDGNIVALDSIKTALKPLKIEINTKNKYLKNDGIDVALLEITIIDINGTPIPDNDLFISYSLTGGAVIIGSDNGDPLDLSEINGNSRRTFKGKFSLAIQSNGKERDVEINFEGKGLIGTKYYLKIK